MKQSPVLLSIIIVSYNTRELLEKCLNSVVKSLASFNFKSNQEKILNQVQDDANRNRHPDENQDLSLSLTQIPDQVRNDGFRVRHYDPAKGGADESQDLSLVEIIVVDNHSQDNTVMWLKKYIRTSAKIRSKIGVELSLIANQENTGFAKANNQGIKKSRGKYVLFLNPDTIVLPETLPSRLAFTSSLVAKKRKRRGLGNGSRPSFTKRSLRENRRTGREYFYVYGGSGMVFSRQESRLSGLFLSSSGNYPSWSRQF